MASVVSDVLQTRMELLGLGPFVRGMADAAEALGLVDLATDKATRRQLAFGIASGAAAAGIAAGMVRTVTAAGRMEQVEIAFSTLLGSAEAARAKIAELQQFAAKTPFSFEEVVKGSQRLLGVGASADQLIPILGALGNAIAATGGSSEEFSRALYAVGQVISNQTLQGDELRQLADAGLPLNDLLKELGTSMGQVGKAGITSARFLEALQKVMNEDRFAGGMERQSKTLFGALSNLGDAGQQAAAALGQPLIGPVTTVTKAITDLTNAFNQASPAVKNAASGLAVLLAGALTVTAIKSAIAVVQLGRLATAHLQAAAAATTHAAANQAVNATMPGGGGVPGGGLPGGTAGKTAGKAAGKLGGLGRIAGVAGRFAGPIGVAAGLYGLYEATQFAGKATADWMRGGSPAAAPAAKAQQPKTWAEELLEEQNALLKQLLEVNKSMGLGKMPLNTSDLAGTQQWAAINKGRAIA